MTHHQTLMDRGGITQQCTNASASNMLSFAQKCPRYIVPFSGGGVIDSHQCAETLISGVIDLRIGHVLALGEPPVRNLGQKLEFTNFA